MGMRILMGRGRVNGTAMHGEAGPQERKQEVLCPRVLSTGRETDTSVGVTWVLRERSPVMLQR